MPSRVEQGCGFGSIQKAYVANLGSKIGVIVTHPWGLLGGNLHNNVVGASVLYFQQLGITTLRFDFGGSQIGRGYKQVEQVKEAAKFLLEEMDESAMDDGSNQVGRRPRPLYLLLVGYSYGSLISLSAAGSHIPQCVGVVSIAPPWSVSHWLLGFHTEQHYIWSKQRPTLPRLFCIGSEDNFTSERAFSNRLKQDFDFEHTTGAVLKDADHFFARRERDLMHVVERWMIKAYPACRGDLSRLKSMDYALYQAPNEGVSGGDSLISTKKACSAFGCGTMPSLR